MSSCDCCDDPMGSRDYKSTGHTTRIVDSQAGISKILVVGSAGEWCSIGRRWPEVGWEGVLDRA